MPNVYTENWVIFLRVRALQIPILYTGKLRQTVRWLSQNYKGSQPFQRLTKFQLNHCSCFCICWASSLTAAPGVENAPFCSMKVINWVKANKSATACAEHPKCIYSLPKRERSLRLQWEALPWQGHATEGRRVQLIPCWTWTWSRLWDKPWPTTAPSLLGDHISLQQM